MRGQKITNPNKMSTIAVLIQSNDLQSTMIARLILFLSHFKIFTNFKNQKAQ